MDNKAFISAVFNKTPIWDKRDKFHSNRNVVEKFWKDISTEMKEDEQKLRKKWKYLRDQFALELEKIATSRSGDAGNICTSKWPYFHLMQFLKDIVKPRPSSGNLSKAASIPCDLPSTSTHITATLDLPDAPVITTPPPISPREEPGENDSGQGDKPPPTASETSSIQMRKKRQRPAHFYNETLLEIERQKLEYFKEKSKHRSQKLIENEDDENLNFFKSLLPHIRKIPETKLLSLRNRVQELVDQYAYQQKFSSPSTPQSSYSNLTIISHDPPQSYQSASQDDVSQSLPISNF